MAVAVQHAAADERLLAGARLAGALTIALAVAVQHTPVPVGLPSLLTLYVVLAVILAVVSWLAPEWPLRHARALHAIDFGWAAVATAISGGVESNLFAIFTVVIVSSAFRWGLSGALRDGLIIVIGGTIQSIAAELNYLPHVATELFVVRLSFIGVGVGVLSGALLQRQHAMRSQMLATAALVSRVSRAPRLDAGLRTAMTEVLRLFSARHVLLVIEETETGRLLRWRADPRIEHGVLVTQLPIPPNERYLWMMRRYQGAEALELTRSDGAEAAARVSVALDDDFSLAGAPVKLPAAITSASAWNTALTIPIGCDGVWQGQLYVLDPSVRPRGEMRLRFLQNVTQQITPALLNLYLMRRVRARAESVERGRISRELHDSVVPTIAGLEMRLDALAREADMNAPAIAGDLRQVRDLLKDHGQEVRDLMQRLRSADVDADRLRGELSDRISRFSRTTGVAARLDWAADEVRLPPRHCSELVRLVQEALINVRRHSGATEVLVRVESDATAFAVTIQDNGHGMGFTGRMPHEELMTEGAGPRVVRERASALGARLDIESSDAGTRLEITLPYDERE